MSYSDRKTLTLAFIQEVLSGESRRDLNYKALYAAEYLRAHLRSVSLPDNDQVQAQLAILKKHFNSIAAQTVIDGYSSKLFEEAVRLWSYWGNPSEIRNETEAGLNSIYGVVEELETNGKELTGKEREVVNSFVRAHRLTLDLFASNRAVTRKAIDVYKALSDTVELIKAIGYESWLNDSGRQSWIACRTTTHHQEGIDDFL